MEWLDQNLDAYRIIAEILNDLREVVRDELEAIHGKTWYKEGLPNGLLDRLIEIKEKEKAIDWYESEYQQVMNYAVFPDLLEILEASAASFPHIMQLAPTTTLLHARFLELEVMRSKLGRARPISDTELAFLGTFHLRFRKAIDDFKEEGPTRRASGARPVTTPVATQDAEASPEQASSPAAEVTDSTDSTPDVSAPEPAAAGPPARSAQAASSEAPVEPAASPAADKPMADEDTAVREVDQGKAKTAEVKTDGEQLETALEEGEVRTILRALYQEVTNTAENIWSRDVLPNTSVWNRVSTSTWYEESFSKLGLKAISDYYEIISKVDEKMRDGISKEDLQQYLKESNFAQILLALRDMFQRNAI
jgi:hypothetical protein